MSIDPILIWAQGYSISAMCSDCRRSGEFFGESKRAALNDARLSGWSMNTKTRTAKCRACNKRRDKQVTP